MRLVPFAAPVVTSATLNITAVVDISPRRLPLVKLLLSLRPLQNLLQAPHMLLRLLPLLLNLHMPEAATEWKIIWLFALEQILTDIAKTELSFLAFLKTLAEEA